MKLSPPPPPPRALIEPQIQVENPWKSGEGKGKKREMGKSSEEAENECKQKEGGME